MTNEEFELLGEPRMTMAQFTLEEQLYGLEESDEALDVDMNEHTPGPWGVREVIARGGTMGYFIQADDGTHITYHEPGEGNFYALLHDEANARLIAETPMMLEACQEIAECIRECNSCEGSGKELGNPADACFSCGGVGQVLGGDDIFAAFKARDILDRIADN